MNKINIVLMIIALFTGFPAVIALSQSAANSAPTNSSSSLISNSLNTPIDYNIEIAKLSSSNSSSETKTSSSISKSYSSAQFGTVFPSSSKVVEDIKPVIKSSLIKVVRDVPVIVENKTEDKKTLPSKDIIVEAPKPIVQQTSKVEEPLKQVESSKIEIVSSSTSISTSSSTSSSVIVAPIKTASISNLSYADKIIARCETLGCNSNQLIRVMRCESTNNPNAYNASGPYIGLFQFLPATFNSYARKIGITNPDIYNSDHQINIATWMFANGQASQWGCK